MIIGNPIMLGGGTGKAFAVIGVTYPEGSTCTCSDGTKTLKLKDTSGQGFFLVPYAATWTVTATDGPNKYVEIVEITSEGQSKSIRLTSILELFVSGKGALVPFTTIIQRSGVANVEFTDEKITISRNSTSYCGYLIRTTDSLDLSKYNVLRIELNVSEINQTNPSQQHHVGISTNAPTVWTDDAPFSFAVSKVISKTGQQTIEMDISSVESGYFAAGLYYYGDITSIVVSQD